MKEYICKEDLIKSLKIVCPDEYIESERVFEEVENFLTVAKEDICREYFEIVKQNIPFELVNDDTNHLLGIMEKLIVEMEQGK